MLGKKAVLIIALSSALVGFIFLVYPNTNFVSKEQPSNNEALVKVTLSGGLCAYGGCLRTITIKGDGVIQVTENKDTYKKEVKDNERLNRLVTALENLDVESLKAEKFSGTCPTAYDGQKAVYEFYTNKGLVVIDSCVYEVDSEKPIYQVIWDIISTDIYGQVGQ